MVSVGVGTPPTAYNLLVETTCANTWIGADKPYTPTSSSKDTGYLGGVYLPTAGRFYTGEEWLDTLDLGSGLVVTNQSIGVASESYGFPPGVDGMLGLAPTLLTVSTLFSQPHGLIPTVADNLYDQATIPEEVFALSLRPSTNADNTAGELYFGGTDPSKYTGQIYYAPLTTTQPSSLFWGFNQTITYGDKPILTNGAGFVDISATLILIASDAYDAYKAAIGATEDTATGMLKLTAAQYANLHDLHFDIGTGTLALPPNGQIWPRALNTYVNGTAGAIYSVVSAVEAPTGWGPGFILGQAFLERFYAVFDATHQRVGLAATSDTNATVN